MGQREVFLHHGYVALHMNATDALLQQLDVDGERRTTYLRDHGDWSDLPFARLRDDSPSATTRRG